MSVQKKSLISSRTSQTTVSKPAEGNGAIGETKTLQATAMTRRVNKQLKRHMFKAVNAKKR